MCWLKLEVSMANRKQLAILYQGVDVWNKWRDENLSVRIELKGANLTQVNLFFTRNVNIPFFPAIMEGKFNDAIEAREGNRRANLSGINFEGADLRGVDLNGTNLSKANLSGADLSDANLGDANLSGSDLRDANLCGASLINTSLVKTKIDNANISNSKIYGVNVWDLDGEFKEQKELIISQVGKPEITVDNIKVAQFIYLILNNDEIRDVLNTLTTKSVLILGRFSLPERKVILDSLRNKLREYNLLPIVFDFERPTEKDFTETIKTLAGISFFVIADITKPKSSPLELQATVPDYQIPFVPIIQEGEQPFAMMVDLQKKYNWVLPTKTYDSIETLMAALKSGIIDPAVEMRNKLRLIKTQEHPTESLRDYLDKSI